MIKGETPQQTPAKEVSPAFLGSRQNDNDLYAFVDIIKKRIGLIAALFIISILSALMYVSVTPPQYVASTEILIHAEEKDLPLESESLMSPSKAGAMHIRSQAEILQSSDILRRMLVSVPLFQTDEFSGQGQATQFDQFSPEAQDYILHKISRHLTVKPVIGTAILSISFRSTNPYLAAQTANAIVQSYITRQSDKNRAANKELSDWLKNRSDSLRRELHALEQKLEDARQEYGLPYTQDGMAEDQKKRLKEEHALLEQEVLEMGAAKDLIRSYKGAANLAAGGSDEYSLLQNHIREKAHLKQQKAELAQRYGAKHPAMIAIDAQLSALDQLIINIEKSIGQQLDAKIAKAKTTMAAIQDKLQIIEKERTRNKKNHTYISELEAETEAARILYDRFITSQKENAHISDWQDNSVDILNIATPPAFPTYPPKALILSLAAVTGLFLGIFAALMMETTRRGFSTVQQLQNETGLPVYGYLPKTRLKNGDRLSRYVLNHPASYIAENTRSILTNLTLRLPKKGCGHVVTLTSTTSGEGKSSIAAAMAVTSRLNGTNVIVIDADMRRPSLHKDFDIGNARGLSDYLSDRIPLDDAIYTKHPRDIHLMTCKAVPTHAHTLLNTDRMQALIRRLREKYDLIIIDTPSSGLFADAQITGQWSDMILYIVEADKTESKDLTPVLEKFWNSGLKDISLILNKINAKTTKRDKALENNYLKDIEKKDNRNRQQLTH